MRFHLLLPAWLAGLLAAAAQADDRFPYTAYINSDDVYVRSGPGKNYYPTDKFRKGQPVEVYRHDPGGWHAIRPPEGSFSWVSSRYLRPTGDGLGVVTGEEVVSRVGSKFSAVRDVTQVRLDRGEQVELLEQVEGPGQTWYKIAPPAGEFRWVSGTFVDRQPPHEGVSRPRSATREAGGGSPEAGERPSLASHLRHDEASHDDDDPPVRQAGYEEEVYDEEPAAGLSVRRSGPRALGRLQPAVEPVAYDEPARGGWSNRDGAAPRIARGATSARSFAPPRGPGGWQAELDRIDAELSAMVAEEPTVWSFRPLLARLEALLDEAGTAIERGRIRQVQHKIARLEDIRLRYQTVAETQDATDRVNRRLRPAAVVPIDSQESPPGPSLSSMQPAEFDGRGILKLVRSTRSNAPGYALVDADGVVNSFVSPSPGVNLQPYVNQYIGLLGTRGYMPDLGKPHVTAKRVTPLAREGGLQIAN